MFSKFPILEPLWRHRSSSSLAVCQFDGMPKDESNDFRPHLGKPSDRRRKGPRTTTALIVRSVAQQGGDLRRLSQPSRERKPSGRFNARGRGRAAAAALEGHGGWEFYADNADGSGMRFRARRVVKARVVKLKGVEAKPSLHICATCSVKVSRSTRAAAVPTRPWRTRPIPRSLPNAVQRTATNSGSLLLPRMVSRSRA